MCSVAILLLTSSPSEIDIVPSYLVQWNNIYRPAGKHVKRVGNKTGLAANSLMNEIPAGTMQSSWKPL